MVGQYLWWYLLVGRAFRVSLAEGNPGSCHCASDAEKDQGIAQHMGTTNTRDLSFGDGFDRGLGKSLIGHARRRGVWSADTVFSYIGGLAGADRDLLACLLNAGDDRRKHHEAFVDDKMGAGGRYVEKEVGADDARYGRGSTEFKTLSLAA